LSAWRAVTSCKKFCTRLKEFNIPALPQKRLPHCSKWILLASIKSTWQPMYYNPNQHVIIHANKNLLTSD
jgi:hypothetical protein